MTKISKKAENGKYNSENEANNLLSVEALHKDFEKNQSPLLVELLKYDRLLTNIASQEVVKRTPVISRFDARCDENVPIISQSTINIIQGKSGTHKSRLAELFCSLLLAHHLTCDTDFLEFFNEIPVTVVYIDTERDFQEQYPAAIQRIRKNAGFDHKSKLTNFFPISIKKFSRSERLPAVNEWLNYAKSLSDKPLFVVLDVVTDCVSSFNNEKESLELFDTLGNFADDHNATFLICIHENPASEKARGHTGTEGQNKASTIIQIGYNSPEEENSDLMKLKFIKTRSSGRPNPIFIKYSKQAHGLILADAEEVKQQIESKKRKFDTDLVKDFLENLLTEPLESKEVYKKLEDEFKVNDRAVINKITELIEDKTIFYDCKGRECFIMREKSPKDKRQLLISLVPAVSEVQTEITFKNS